MRIVKKIVFFVLFFAFIIFNNCISVNASQDLDGIDMEMINSLEPGTIIKYSLITNEITVIDMEEIENTLKEKGIYSTDTFTTASENMLSKSRNKFLNATNEFMNTKSSSATRILDTSTYPSRIVFRVTGFDYQDNFHIGSGTMVGEQLALTNAHCVVSQNLLGNYVGFTNVLVSPGFNSTAVYGSGSAIDILIPTDYLTATNANKPQYDWALIIVDDSNLTSFSEWAVCSVYSSSSDLVGTNVRGFGYPAQVSYGFNQYGLYPYVTYGHISSVATYYLLDIPC